MNSPTVPPEDDQVFQFLDLPPDVRIVVYACCVEQIVADRKTLLCENATRDRACSNLTQTCQQICREFRPIYLQHIRTKPLRLNTLSSVLPTLLGFTSVLQKSITLLVNIKVETTMELYDILPLLRAAVAPDGLKVIFGGPGKQRRLAKRLQIIVRDKRVQLQSLMESNVQSIWINALNNYFAVAFSGERNLQDWIASRGISAELPAFWTELGFEDRHQRRMHLEVSNSTSLKKECTLLRRGCRWSYQLGWPISWSPSEGLVDSQEF